MNRSESRYFSTAVRMDEAFLRLLEKKDFEYITVQEICREAGVSRSTFYFHYETLGDLLEESTQHIYDSFQSYFDVSSGEFIARLSSCPPEELDLLTPKYVLPYLRYVREHRRLFRTALKNVRTLRLEAAYESLFRHIFAPILARCQVPEADRAYLMAFYIHGLMAIVNRWLENDCADPEERVLALMRACAARE